MSGGGIERKSDIPTEADRKANIQSREGAFDICHAIQVARIIGQNFNGGAVPLERHPVIFLQVIDIQIFQ